MTKTNNAIAQLLYKTFEENHNQGDSFEEVAESTGITESILNQLKAGTLTLTDISEKYYNELSRYANQADNTLQVEEDIFTAQLIIAKMVDDTHLKGYTLNKVDDNDCVINFNFEYFVSENYMIDLYADIKNEVLNLDKRSA